MERLWLYILDLSWPIKSNIEFLELSLHLFDVLLCPDFGVHASVASGILGGKSEGIPSDGVEYLWSRQRGPISYFESFQSVIPRQTICNGVSRCRYRRIKRRHTLERVPYADCRKDTETWGEHRDPSLELLLMCWQSSAAWREARRRIECMVLVEKSVDSFFLSDWKEDIETKRIFSIHGANESDWNGQNDCRSEIDCCFDGWNWLFVSLFPECLMTILLWNMVT